MTKITCFFCGLFISCFASASDGQWAVAKIDPALLKNAHAVLRMEDEKFEYVGLREAYHTDHYVITILDESGDEWAEFSQF